MPPLKDSLHSNKTFWKNPFIVVVSTVLLYIAAQVVGALAVLPFMAFIPNKNVQYAVILGATLLAFCGFVSTATRVIGFRWADIGIKHTSLRNILLVIPTFVIYGLISTVLMAIAARLSGFDANQAQDVGLNKAGLENIIAAFVMLVIITPFFEELLFRGVLFHGLRKRLPFIVAALVTSIVFAVAHGQANVAVDTFALSMFLCLLAEKTTSIWPSITLHALKNFIAFGALFLGWFK